MEREPAASRPRLHIDAVPEGQKGLLPWEWARARLGRSHNYWFTTVRAGGVPHSMPVWGVWLDDVWYFCTAPGSRKARNLSENPHCVVCTEDAQEAVILEGAARELPASEVPHNLAPAYKTKYGWDLQLSVFEVRPRAVFAMPEKQFPQGATRWVFSKGR
jgi:nitroimidazol reductase NimA-like FMN-containing flavoprotein (pyridoxamine 5'-phosphate oxidase superfamily)